MEERKDFNKCFEYLKEFVSFTRFGDMCYNIPSPSSEKLQEIGNFILDMKEKYEGFSRESFSKRTNPL